MPPRNQTGNVQINKNEVDHKGEVQIDRQQNDQMHNPFHFQADQPMNNPLDMQADKPVNNVVVSREQIENEINTILRDTRRMARFQKVIACAALYDQADTEADKINSLFAIRESAANYLSQRKVTSSVER